MSFVVWTVLRKLPKPALLALLVFLLTAMARAETAFAGAANAPARTLDIHFNFVAVTSS